MDINYYKQYEPLFGAWKIVRQIGEGGFGKVFEIGREDFGTTYKAALKVITIPQSPDEIEDVRADGMDDASIESYYYGFVQELVGEFALMAQLKGQSNIVSYEDHSVVRHPQGIGWDIFIRMELLTPLNEYLRKRSISVREVIKLGIDLCHALELCQKYRIIHRDVKPENIFVSPNGDFKLGDFGIARSVEKAASVRSKKGTYKYMAPEVFSGESYDSSVDLYSLGLVLYRLLNNNRLPFLPPAPAPITHSDYENALLKRVGGAALPMPQNASGRLGEIVLKACAHRPANRYSSPVQMRQELEAILYSREEAPLIYPQGDEAPVQTVEYADSMREEKRPEQTRPLLAANEPPYGGSPAAPGAGRTLPDSGRTTPNSSRMTPDSSRTTPDSAPRQQPDADPAPEGETVGIFGPRAPRTAQTDGAAASQTETVGIFSTAPPAKKAPGPLHTRPQRAAPPQNTLPQNTLPDTGPPHTGRRCTNPPQTELRPPARKKAVILAACAAAVIALAAGGTALYFSRQTDLRYEALVTQAQQLRETDAAQALALTAQAQALRENRAEAFVEEAYILYLDGRFEQSLSAAARAAENHPQNSELICLLASNEFELGQYEAAAAHYRALADDENYQLSLDSMRDRSVCLARLGQYEDALACLLLLQDAGAKPQTVQYVLGEVEYARGDYSAASRDFLQALDACADETVLARRCWISLAETYRALGDHTALIETADRAFSSPALANNTVLLEMQGEAYYLRASQTQEPDDYIAAASCFERVIGLGVRKDYLYTNAFICYHAVSSYASAANILNDMMQTYPSSYTPHALMATLLIEQENQKPEAQRSYEAAAAEYEQAAKLARPQDDQTYLQQLEGLIGQLRTGGWL